jgi:hypothetical protein
MTPLPPLPIVDGVLSIDNSFCEAEQRCAVYAHNIYGHRRVSGFDDPAQHFGKAFHAAMEWRYKNCASKAPTKAEELEMEKVVEAAFIDRKVGFDENGLAIISETPIHVSEDEYRNVGRCKEVVAAYNAEYRDEPFECVATEMGLERELGELGGDFVWCASCAAVNSVTYYGSCHGCGGLDTHPIKVNYQGRIDGAVRYTQKIMPRDFKTMKQIDRDREAAKWSMSGQMRGYCFLLSDPKLGFGDVTSFWIDQVVVRPPTSTARAKLPRNDFFRDQHSCTKESIAEWQRDTLLRVENWLRSCLSPSGPPMSRSSCVWPKKCQFIDVCQLPTPEQRSAWLQSGAFKDNEFRPLAK